MLRGVGGLSKGTGNITCPYKFAQGVLQNTESVAGVCAGPNLKQTLPAGALLSLPEGIDGCSAQSMHSTGLAHHRAYTSEVHFLWEAIGGQG